MNNKTEKKTKIKFVSRLTPKQDQEQAQESRVPSIDEVKIGQTFFVTEAGRTSIY
ncbi:hypothetical protein [Cystobacter fuscus]|uniref:hypothetical protein n=1 Tax=Cystobacter fuscus TaxID=43 RepID=UPI0037C04489